MVWYGNVNKALENTSFITITTDNSALVFIVQLTSGGGTNTTSNPCR